MYDEIIKHLAEKSRRAIQRNPEDYVENGLLMCGKCHTPKQTVIHLPSGVITPMCLCQCEQERLAAEEEAQRKYDAEKRKQRMRSAGFPDAEMCRWNFAADDGSNPKLMRVAKNYADNFPRMLQGGKGLILYGDTGTGKSFAAACICNDLIERGHKCLMTNFARLINQLQSTFEGKQEILDDLNRYSLLVLDDLGSERDTSYMQETIFNLIDSRYRSKLPLIVTSNLSGEEFRNPGGIDKKRIYSRLYEMCLPVKVEGADRRSQALKNDYAELKGLLGL